MQKHGRDFMKTKLRTAMLYTILLALYSTLNFNFNTTFICTENSTNRNTNNGFKYIGAWEWKPVMDLATSVIELHKLLAKHN